MEQALGARERTLLGTVPTLLGPHFERLRAAAEAGGAAEAAERPDGASAAPPTPSRAWLEAFRKDMQSVLLAELDVRFQPVDGLLAALRSC